jgi:CMP-N,N'-diacetyllegionaminic acid synthase
MNILITICARGGSKGIPGKNIKLLNGKHLIAYTIELAQVFALKYQADIALSTDSDEIKNVAALYNLHTPYSRPKELATDTAGKIDAISELLQFMQAKTDKVYDFVIDLDVTSPLRTVQDIENAYHILKKNEKALNIFSVNQARRNPYFNMVEEAENGFFNTVKDGKVFKSRQKAPKVYDMNGSIYVYRKKFFDEGWDVSTTNASIVYIMRHICFDLDEKEDFIIMETLLKENLLDFKLE